MTRLILGTFVFFAFLLSSFVAVAERRSFEDMITEGVIKNRENSEDVATIEAEEEDSTDTVLKCNIEAENDFDFMFEVFRLEGDLCFSEISELICKISVKPCLAEARSLRDQFLDYLKDDDQDDTEEVDYGAMLDEESRRILDRKR